MTSLLRHVKRNNDIAFFVRESHSIEQNEIVRRGQCFGCSRLERAPVTMVTRLSAKYPRRPSLLWRWLMDGERSQTWAGFGCGDGVGCCGYGGD